MTAGVQSLAISVDFDLICPWCWIGLRQLVRARQRFTASYPDIVVETTWRPAQLLPDLPEDGVPYTAFYVRRLGSFEAVRTRQAQVQAAARDAGLEIDFAAIVRMPNTARAHRLLRRVAALCRPALYETLLERLFAAHFRRGEDLGDTATLRRIARELGVPDDVAGSDGTAMETAPAMTGVPHFVFNGGLAVSGARDAATLLEAMTWATVAPKVPTA